MASTGTPERVFQALRLKCAYWQTDLRGGTNGTNSGVQAGEDFLYVLNSGVQAGEDFLYVFKPGRHGPDAPPLAPAMRSLPLRSASAPGGSRVTRGCGCGGVASGRRRRGLCGAAPPASSPLRAPIRPAPPRIDRWSGDHHRGTWVTSGGAGRIGSKRLDPGAPATPRPALPAGQGPAVGARASLSLHAPRAFGVQQPWRRGDPRVGGGRS